MFKPNTECVAHGLAINLIFDGIHGGIYEWGFNWDKLQSGQHGKTLECK